MRSESGPNIGMCFDRTFPAAAVTEFAERLEADGVDQLWVIEDCFYTAAVSLAATALAHTERLEVGLGILPAVARNPAITAMEIATLCQLAPGRVIAGIGHGVQDWMHQIGARTPSPLNTLEEVLVTVRRLLAAETVDFEGRHVTMRNVTLDNPPSVIPPLLAGVRGPKSLELAGRVCDGVVLAEGAGPTYVAGAIAHAGSPEPFRVSVFTALCLDDDAATARRAMAPFLAGLLDRPQAAIEAHPHFDEMRELYAARGTEGLATMPGDWWLDVGAIGDMQAVVTHIEALAEAGAADVALFPDPDIELAREDLHQIGRIAAAVRDR